MSKTTDYVIEVMNEIHIKEIEIQLEMIDPKDSYIFDLDNNLH